MCPRFTRKELITCKTLVIILPIKVGIIEGQKQKTERYKRQSQIEQIMEVLP